MAESTVVRTILVLGQKDLSVTRYDDGCEVEIKDCVGGSREKAFVPRDRVVYLIETMGAMMEQEDE